MKSKGFTLIELLAVIVILAIIALIATPIILNIINDTKEEANKRSVEMYAKAIENAVAQAQYKNQEVFGIYTTKEKTNGKVLKLKTNDKNELTVEFDGNVVCNIIEINKNGTVYLEECKVNNELTGYAYGTKQSYYNGQIVYFDVYNGISCTEKDYHQDNSKTGYNGIYEGENSTSTTDNQNSCLKFYAFNDDLGDSINLILDHNTTATVTWNSSGSNKSGPSIGETQLLGKLKIDTVGWKGTIEPENYSNGVYTVDYSEYKARLITAQEIAVIAGNIDWNETTASEYYYLDSLMSTQSTTCKYATDISECKYGWLYDRTNTGCNAYGCLNNSDIHTFGYWTISSCISTTNYAWRIRYTSTMSNDKITDTGSYGVRPVIEVLRSKLN